MAFPQTCTVVISQTGSLKIFVPTSVTNSTVTDNDGDTLSLDVWVEAIKYQEDSTETTSGYGQTGALGHPIWLTAELINNVVVGGIRTADVQITLNENEADQEVPSKTIQYIKIGIEVDDGTNQVSDFFLYSPDAGALVFDSFTDTNGTELSAHAPDVDDVGGGWSEVSGDWEINAANQAVRNTPGAGPDYAVIDSGEADVNVTVEVTTSGTAWTVGVVVRRSGANEINVVYDEAAGTIEVFENAISQTSSSVSVAAGSHTILVKCVGQNITVFLDTISVLTHTTAFNQTATEHGIYEAGASSNETFDSFTITRAA